MAPARRMTRSNREVYPIMFLSIHQIHHLQIPLNLYTLTLFISLGYIVSINFILITRMQDSDSSYSYESQRSEEQQFIDQNDTDQGTAEFVNRQDLDTFPYNAIGAVAFKTYQNQPRLWNGTGFLVSPNLVLTVAHNIINNKQLTEYIDLQFYHMLHGQLKDPIKVIDWKFPQEYKKIYFKDKKSLKYDYALLKLQRDIIIGKYFKLAQKLTNDREQISIFGYQGFMRDGKVQTGRQIEFRGETQISIIKIDPKQMEIRHTLPSKSGQSGSPIITVQHEVVSIHKGGIKNKPYNIGVLVNKDMINNLRKWQMQMNSKQTIQVTQYLKQRSLEHSRLLIRTASQRDKLVPTKIIEENRYQKFPYCCIGQIVIQYLGDKQKNGVNTGFLISNNLVLTSFNSIFNPQIQNFNSKNPKIKVFFIPASKTINRQKIPIQSFRINPQSLNLSIQKFSCKTKNQDLLEDIYYDYCLLKLSRNIQTKDSEYLQLAVNYTHTQKNYSVYGYPSRNHQGKQIQNPKLEGNISSELDTYIDRHMIAHNIDTKFGMIGSPIIVDYNKVVGIHKLKLLKYNMCKGGRLITNDLIDKLYEWNKQLQGSPFSVHYYNQQDYVPVSNSKQLLQQHEYFKSKLRESRRLQLRSSRSNI